MLTEGFELIQLKKESDEDIHNVVKFIRRNKFNTWEYAGKFVICEILNFLNVLFQFLYIMWLFDIEVGILVNDFVTSKSNVKPEHPLSLIFPTVARCEVPFQGGAGLTFLPEFCVLPVNVFTKKVYIFLW